MKKMENHLFSDCSLRNSIYVVCIVYYQYGNRALQEAEILLKGCIIYAL